MPSMRCLRRIAWLVLSACALAAPASASATSSTPIALGVNVSGGPGQLAPMQSFASLSGANPSIVMWFQQWSEPLFYSTQLPNTQAMGAIPMITWDPSLNGTGIPLAQIADGAYDSYITQSADASRAWKRPIYIRFAHEMNIGASGFGPGQNGNTAADFIAAWRHVVTIFRQQGATNAEWVWSPNVDCGGRCPFTSLYPGDAWVDWVALDGYNYSSVDNVPWESFDQIFRPSYAEMTALTSKPMMIAETASAEQGGNKAQWITQTFADIAQSYPQIHAVVWFDRVKETDWTVNSSAGSLAAWQSLVASPDYAGTADTLLQDSPLAADVDSATASAITPTTTRANPTTSTTSAPSTVLPSTVTVTGPTPTTPTVTVPPVTTPTVTVAPVISPVVTTPAVTVPPVTTPPLTVGPVATVSAPASAMPPPTTTATPSAPATTVPPFISDPVGTPPADGGRAMPSMSVAAVVRSAVASALHGVADHAGGLRGLVRLLRGHGYAMSFRAPCAGTLAVSVSLTPPATGHGHQRREILVATSRRRVSLADDARITIRPTAQGRRVLQHVTGRRITVKLGFTPLGRPRLAASESVSSR